ncbi:hypothetical protein DRF75_02040 [Ehrlichia minasensis]|uniref:Uncharacterized protein n=1 Tax=Ehrlichia minasensis TaxID=1242993 RepID=A0A4Q6I6E3_9RICK|nr:hypothetical protein [Ehrlichia minasensis]RZB12870.1 hypothetical protein DRF75_02040 [Ehrlichia minasensis]
MDMINVFDNIESDTLHVSNFINQDSIYKFTVTVLPASVVNNSADINDDIYSVVFSYKRYEAQQPYDLVDNETIRFDAHFDHIDHKLYLTKDDISVVLDEDMLSSCLSCIKLINNNITNI